MYNKKSITFAMIMLITTMLLAVLPIMPAFSQATNLKVEPPEHIFYTNTTSVGTTFKISIIVENVADFYGWEFFLTWTPGMINCTTETINFGVWPAFLGPWVSPSIDNVAGTYHQSLTARAPSTPKTGTFWLVNLTFTITQAPPDGGTLSTDLTLEPAAGYVYCLLDDQGNELPHIFSHGLYQFISPRPPVEEITVKVTPPSIANPSLVPSTEFHVNITALDASYLHGFTLQLSYNASVIECTLAEEGDLLQSFGTTMFMFTIDNILGNIYASVNLTSAGVVASGDGTLVELTFHVLDIGDSPLHLYDTHLYDAEGVELVHITQDGYFNNVLMPKLYVDPPEIIDPTMVPPAEFSININVANVTDLYDFEFTLLYDTDVLNGLGVIFYPFENETSFEVEFALNDTAGKMWVKVQYYPPAESLTTTDPVTLVTIFFQVQSFGATVLDLTDTSLSDSLGGQITHEAEDGFVSILIRDVAIIDITPEFYEVYRSWTIEVNVTAENLGDISETFNVTLFMDGHEMGEQEVTGLAPNATTTLTFLLSINEAWQEPCHNYTLSAEASEVPYEVDTANNVLVDGDIHVKLMGDINGDGYVNALDAIIMGNAFGTHPGEPNWNPNADLNMDGWINAKDVVLLGMNFGTQCVP
ncbi:hypothetical protein HXY33_03455 [Candidatus Bathyarchaeota archaeon]|nr:hypothetical protein [Candidatus Bathyarchaeota archaeon]